MSTLNEVKESMKDRLYKLAQRVEHAGNSDTDIEEEIQNVLYFLVQLSQLSPDVDDCIEKVLQALAHVQKSHPASSGNKPHLLYTATVGRPSFKIPIETLDYLIQQRFTVKQIASLLGVSEKTINNRMKEYGLSIRASYTTISDDELDVLVKSVTSEFPNIGHKSISGHLAAKGHRVQQDRVMASVRRVDPVGVLVRNLFFRTHRIKRRQYYVPAPMALWHVDSYHKLIRWRFIVHGGIDGYSRLPMYLYVESDNTATTAMKGFMQGVEEYGLPQRVRTDKGGENVEIAKFMLHSRGLGRGSIITGRSVHNQRIERFWGEVWHGCINTYHQLFQYMEEHGMLNPDSEVDIYTLHIVYLERIRTSLARFTASIARRPIRTENNQTPLALWIAGQVLDNSIELCSEEDINTYGIDSEGLPQYQPEEEVTLHVPSLMDIGYDLEEQVKSMVVAQNISGHPYETDTYLQLQEYLTGQLNL